MKISLTKEEFINSVRWITPTDIANHVETLGIEFKKELPELPEGIYRREKGVDLINFRNGIWNSVNWDGATSTHITWACMEDSGADWWVQVLNCDHRAVVHGARVQFDGEGNRVG